MPNSDRSDSQAILVSNTYQEFGDRLQQFDDGDLIAAIKVLLMTGRAGGRTGALQEAVEQWTDTLHRYGPGVISMDLDRVLATPEAKADFFRLLDDVRRCIRSFGESIPAGFLTDLPPEVAAETARDPTIGHRLNSVGATPPWFIWTIDYPTSRLTRTIDQLERLVRGEPREAGR